MFVTSCDPRSLSYNVNHHVWYTHLLRGLLKIDVFGSNELSNPWHFLKQQFKVYQNTLMSVSKKTFLHKQSL